MTDLLTVLLSTGDEADYAVALDLCEQEGWALDVGDSGSAGPWGTLSSRSGVTVGRDGRLESATLGGHHCATIGVKCGSVSGSSGRLSEVNRGRESLGSRGPRWFPSWPRDS